MPSFAWYAPGIRAPSCSARRARRHCWPPSPRRVGRERRPNPPESPQLPQLSLELFDLTLFRTQAGGQLGFFLLESLDYLAEAL